MSEIQVTTAQLKRKADELGGLSNQLKNKINELVTAERTLNNLWTGEAHDAFHKAFLTDKEKFAQFQEMINVYMQSLRMIAEEYEAAERANISTASARTYGS